MDQLPCTSTHQGSPKALVPVLLARHTRRNLRARISYLAMYCLWVCLSVKTQESSFKQASDNLERKTPRQETNNPLQGKSASPGNRYPLQGRKRLARAKSKRLIKFPLAGFCPSSLFSLSYASWAACTLKGSPIVGPGATVGTVETRVPWASLLGPTTSFGRFR